MEFGPMRTKDVADASPTKQFFIRMITRDIRLEDCILDLIDNSLDGATRAMHGRSVEESKKFAGFRIDLKFNGMFSIKDDCGGIGVELAKTKAFHFGRPENSKADDDLMIGLYGIGMKRALFKIGKDFQILSSTHGDAFIMHVEVDKWAAKPEWNFEMDVVDPWKPAGTEIIIANLRPEIATTLKDPTFLSQIRTIIARDYSIFLQKELQIYVNKELVKALPYSLREGDEFAPFRDEYEDDGVVVRISAGLAGLPPDDTAAELEVSKTEYYGWFVLCNDRVVLAADKSSKTVWENDGFASWHPQYNGFMGMVEFSSKDAAKLPWTTTKRDLDTQNPVYTRAVAKMKQVTTKFITYTTRRKADLSAAKALETKTRQVPLHAIRKNLELKLPAITTSPTRQLTTVNYQVTKAEVKDVATAMGEPNMPNTRVGLETFRYYQKHELGK